MKRTMMLLCALLAVLMLTVAAAETQESWNKGCTWRLTGEAQVWNLPSDASSGSAAVMTLPKGTWVRVVTRDGQWMVIDYYAGNGMRSGTVAADLVMPADGSATAAPTATPLPIAKATAKAPTVTPSPTPAPVIQPDGGMLTALTTATPAPTAAGTSGLVISVVYEDAIIDAEIITLGSCTTLVKGQGLQMAVSTADITCSDSVAANHQIAVISAPKKGSATVKEAASGKSKGLGKLKDGTIVCVLEEGKDYCKVWSPGMTGYVVTSVLNYDVYVSNPVGTAILQSSKGKTTGKTTVNVRVAPKKTAKISAELTVGTEVTVLKIQDDWYLVELAGHRGYVNKQFIKQ